MDNTWWKVIAHLWREPGVETEEQDAEFFDDVRYLAAVILEGRPVEEIDWERVTPEAVSFLQEHIYAIPTWEEGYDETDCAAQLLSNPTNPILDIALLLRVHGELAGAPGARQAAQRRRFF